ncbi:MAG TPA: PEP-CTERM sorting domain-containing protein [Anaerohalosphaeraceae bacterium]|nr:PEP-CTERM sorting domain-containing protein [Anaerohalosphaeraceae bacterium]
MKKGTWMMGLVCLLTAAVPVSAFTPVLDGILNEWTGPGIVNLGTQPGIDTGTYALLAGWDDSNLYIAVDRNSTNRYLGDDYWAHDSFFFAIDTDGIAGSGASQDGYGILSFAGTMRPDFIYCYAGGAGWYETCNWTGTYWNWNGWTNAGTYYGWNEDYPNDEMTIPLSVIGGSRQVMVWAWMTREGIYDTVDASWPAGTTGYRPVFGDGAMIPEPASLTLFGLGGLLLAVRRKK